MSDLKTKLNEAVASGKLLESSANNILQLLASSGSPIYTESIQELVSSGEWSELNDRFFRTLAFGTGGLRGRTIGKVVTRVELGKPAPNGRPEQPCTGSNSVNYYNISRATQGLVAYLKDCFLRDNRPGKPKIAIAHDTRHFSREFAELLRLADAIYIEELRKHALYDQVSQAFAVFLPVKSVAVMGDGRKYDWVIALRAVETIDFMTARWSRLPYEFLEHVSLRIVNEVPGVSRVVYDVSGKPPATIEWE